MTDSQVALAELARAFRTRVRPAVGDFGPDGVLIAEARFRPGPLKVTAFGTTLRIILEVRGFRQQLLFSLNRPEDYRRDAVTVGSIDHSTVLGYSIGDRMAALQTWLEVPYHRALLAALGLAPDEYMHFYENGAWISVFPERATPDLVTRLQAIVKACPPIGGNVPTDAVADLPPSLRPLVPLFREWAIEDDEERTRKINHSGRVRLRKFHGAVEPLLGEIDEYLRSFGSRPLPLVAVRIGLLAEAVAEIRAGEPE